MNTRQLTLSIVALAALAGPLNAATTSERGLRARDLRVTWDGDRGGQLVRVEGRDHRGWFMLSSRAQAVGDLVISDGERDYLASAGRLAAPPVVSRQNGITRREQTVVPRAADGTESPLRITQTFFTYDEGAVFCDFTLALPADAAPCTITRVALRSTMDSGSFPRYRWFWKRDWSGDLYLDRARDLDAKGYLRSMGASVARQQIGFTTHWELFLERKLGLVDAADGGMSCEVTAETGGAKAYVWNLYRGPARAISPGFIYNNRWGLDAASVRQTDNAIGQRIAHWQEGTAALMSFPSDSAIKAMADCGVTVNVLHLYWKTPQWGSDFSPNDPAGMKRWVQTCHRYGIKCVLYAIPIDKPGIDGINAESYGRYNCDGLYFDFGSVHFRGSAPNSAEAYYAGRDFPAMDFLNLTRHYREVVGVDGIMIAHAGGAAPDALYCLNLNAYLPGEAGEQGGLLSANREEAWYHSGLAYAVSHPWCEYQPFQTREAVASFCAMGAFPHALFGRGTHQDNNYHRSIPVAGRFAPPYWQMLRTVPMDRGTTMYNELTDIAATADSPDAHCVVYRRNAQLMLVTVSNLGAARQVAVNLVRQVARPAAGLHAYYLSGRDIVEFTITDRGQWSGGPLRTGTLTMGEYAAFVLAGPDELPALQARLAKVRRLVGMFTEKRSPGPILGLQAKVEFGAVHLSWQAADDDSHVVEYRLRRTCAGRTTDLQPVEETTTHDDYTAEPGRQVTYEVRAADVAGNVGPAATLTVHTQGAAFAPDIAAGDNGTLVSGVWAGGNGWLWQAPNRVPATAEGVLHKVGPRRARFLRVYVTGGAGNYETAHIVELTAFAPDGTKLTPRAAISSGDDPGHPVSDIMDGITDKTVNGWWSDRTRSLPMWAGLDFGQAVDIGSVRVLTFWDGVRYYDYAIEVSDDGQEWAALAATDAAAPLARKLWGVQLTDGTASVTTIERAPDRSGGGLLFRCPDANNGYALFLDNNWDGYVMLSKMTNGRLQTLKGAFFPYSIARPIPHILKVQLEGPRITCYADGIRVFEVSDSTYPSGQVGVFSLTGGPVGFTNLLVEGGRTR